MANVIFLSNFLNYFFLNRNAHLLVFNNINNLDHMCEVVGKYWAEEFVKWRNHP